MSKKDFHNSRSSKDPTPGSWIEALSNQEAQDQLVRDILGNEGGERMIREGLVEFLADQLRRGVDISAAHPEAFSLLLSDTEARQAFSALIEGLEIDNNADSQLPSIGEIDLSFLKESEQTRFLRAGTSSWLLQLRRTVEELRNIYQPPTLAYRGNNSQIVPDWISVVQEEAPINQEISIALTLEATGSDNPKEIGLFLSVAASSIGGSKLPEMAYALGLEWGTYKQRIETQDVFRLPLPPLPLSAITQDGQISQAMNLTLSAIAR